MASHEQDAQSEPGEHLTPMETGVKNHVAPATGERQARDQPIARTLMVEREPPASEPDELEQAAAIRARIDQAVEALGTETNALRDDIIAMEEFVEKEEARSAQVMGEQTEPTLAATTRSKLPASCSTAGARSLRARKR